MNKNVAGFFYILIMVSILPSDSYNLSLSLSFPLQSLSRFISVIIIIIVVVVVVIFSLLFPNRPFIYILCPTNISSSLPPPPPSRRIDFLPPVLRSVA